MKYLIGLLPLFFVSNLLATNLCDSSCNLSITFPDGGSIKSVRKSTITFGTGGFVNNGSSTIAYPDGKKLRLGRKDSIDFQNGGEFDIGQSGNIEYEEIKITSDGVFNLSADKNQQVVIDKLKLNGRVVFNIYSDFEVKSGGELRFKDGLVVPSVAELKFVNLGKVTGRFVFQKAVIHYIKDKKSYKKDSVIEKILGSLLSGDTTYIKEVEKSEELSGEIFLDTDREFILVTKEPKSVDDSDDGTDDSADVSDGAVISDSATNTTQVESSSEIDEAGISDNQSPADDPLNNAVSVASAGAYNIFVIMFVLFTLLKLRAARPEKSRKSQSY